MSTPSPPPPHLSTGIPGSDSERSGQLKVRGVVAEMQAALEDEGLQSSGCKEIADWLGDDGRFANEVVAAGGLVAVTEAMRTHLKSPAVLNRGFRCLEKLATGGGEPCRAALLEAGGLDVALGGLRENFRHSDILGSGLRALTGFLHGEKSTIEQRLLADSNAPPDGGAGVKEGAKLKQALVDAGCIGLCIRAITEHASDALVQHIGFSVLHGLWDSASGVRSFSDEGGVAAVLQGMKAHVGDSAVQQSGCVALKVLLCVNKASREEVMRAGGLAATVTGMRQHLRNATVQISGCQVLGAFACAVLEEIDRPELLDDEVEIKRSEAVLNGGGVGAVIRAMQAHRSQVDVQRVCLFVLEFVCRKSTACQIAIVNHRAVIDVIAATRQHPNNETIKASALGLLARIARGTELGKRTVMELGAVRMAARALQEEPGSGLAKSAACSCLVAVSAAVTGTPGTSQSMNAIVAGGGVRALVAVLRSPSACPRIAFQARGLLCVLSQCTACNTIGSSCTECTKRRRTMVAEGALDAALASLERSKTSRVERTPVVLMLESLVECEPGPIVGAHELVFALVEAMQLDDADVSVAAGEPVDAGVPPRQLPSAPSAETYNAACYALICCIGRDDRCRGLVMEAGGVSAAVAVASTRLAEVRVQSATCLLLSSLAGEDKELAAQLADARTGVLQTVVAAMKQHCRPTCVRDSDAQEEAARESPEAADRLQRHALSVLGCFLRHGDATVQAVLEAGAAGAVMSAMAGHGHNEALVGLCFHALAIMVWEADDKERSLMADAQMLAGLARALKLHPNLRERGMKTLHSICEGACLISAKRQEEPPGKRQRTAEGQDQTCAQTTLRSLPSGLLGQIWPAERVGVGSQVCKWLRDDLALQCPAVLFEVASHMHVSSAITHADVCSTISRFQRGAVSLQCCGSEPGDRADAIHFMVTRLFSLLSPVTEPSLSGVTRLMLNGGNFDRAQSWLLRKGIPRCHGLVELDLASCQLGWEGAMELFQETGDESLVSCTQLASVNLADNEIGDVGATWLARSLGKWQALAVVNLTGNSIGEIGARALAPALCVCPLEELLMGNNNLGGAGTVALCAALPSLNKLRVLNLSSNSLGSDQAHGHVEMLAQCLRGCKRLEVLDLDNNGIGDNEIELLVTGIEQCPLLSHLALGTNSMGGTSVASLAKALKGKKHLRHLDLEANEISDEGVKSLASMISSFDGGGGLRYLSLEDNKFGDEGMTSLAAVLPECAELEELYLSGNTIGDAGAAHLAKALMRCVKKVEECTLEENELGDEGFRCLLGVVQAGRVRRLHVNGNQIGGGGVDALLEMLSSCAERPMSDVFINISANPIDADGCVALIPALASCQSPPFLRFSRREGMV